MSQCWFFIHGGECCKPIIPCAVQEYFWHAQPRSDATHVKRPDHWVRSDVMSSPHHQVMRWQVHHLSTASSPQRRTAFLHRHSVLDRPNTSDFMCISLEVRARYTCIWALKESVLTAHNFLFGLLIESTSLPSLSNLLLPESSTLLSCHAVPRLTASGYRLELYMTLRI